MTTQHTFPEWRPATELETREFHSMFKFAHLTGARETPAGVEVPTLPKGFASRETVEGWDHDGADWFTEPIRGTDGELYRARIVYDAAPHPPEADMQAPVLEVRSSRELGRTVQGDDSVPHDGLEWDIQDVWEYLGRDSGSISETVRRVSRYLSIFHGGSMVDVSGNEYVAYDTRAMRVDYWGQDKDVPSAPDATEWAAYAEGETYGIAVEVYRPDSEEWEEVETCWGFYGETWARQSALEELEAHLRALLADPPEHRVASEQHALRIESQGDDPLRQCACGHEAGSDAAWAEHLRAPERTNAIANAREALRIWDDETWDDDVAYGLAAALRALLDAL